MRERFRPGRRGVLIVSYKDDEHGTAVERLLAEASVGTIRLSEADLRETLLSWTTEALTLGGQRTVGIRPSRALWRRSGSAPVDDLDRRFAAFASSESRDFFNGAMATLDAEWLTHPFQLVAAENKLNQLAVAHDLNLPIPRTLVTNDYLRAREFVRSCGGRVVAKPVRYGLVTSEPQPLMAWVRLISETELEPLYGIPTMFQVEIRADRHLRIVTVGTELFACWTTADDLDWRSGDQGALRWQAISVRTLPAGVARHALRLAKRLHIGFSSQDWIVDRSGRAWFIEANPNGQWLFLDPAHDGAITNSVASWLQAAP